MPAGAIPVEIYEILAQSREAQRERLRAKVAEIEPGVAHERVQWLQERSELFHDLFEAFLREGSLEAIREPIREACRALAESGTSLEFFVRLLLEATAQGRENLINALPGREHLLPRIFIWLGEYETALFDEFAKAQAARWRRREREAEKLHADFFNNAPFPAFAGGADLVIDEFNPAAVDRLHAEPERIRGENFFDFLGSLGAPPEDLAALRRKLESRGQLGETGLRVATAEGREMHFLVSLNWLQREDGSRRGFQAVLRDVTARKAMEASLTGYLAQMDAVFNSAPLGLIYVDARRVIQRINREACDMLGYPPPSEIERGEMAAFRDRAKENYADPAGFARLLEEVYADPAAHREGVLEVVRPRAREVAYRVSPVRRPGGEPIGWLWIFIDVTERAAADRLRRDLTHMIVHDLKNPLTAILGAAGAIRPMLEGAKPMAREALALLQRNADRMLAMIMNLLDIERLESGKLDLALGEVPIERALGSVIEHQRPAAGSRRLEAEIDGSLRGSSLRVDADLLDRVLTNLVSNAIKHTRPDGRIELRARPGPAGEAILSVVDDGAGIAREHHEKIFEKFGQAELRREGRQTDTGLGLAFCKLATEAHGGRICVESEPGRGSTFSVAMPLAPEGAGEAGHS